MLSTINLELWKVTIHTKEVDGKFDKKLKKLMNRPHMEINSCKELSQQNVQVKCKVHSYSHARLIYWMICNRKQIEFWRITLKYDGLYQLVFLVEMTFPTEVAEFLVIISVMERCYELKSWFLKLSKR
ncbi:uncharacterized protein OCT59_013792 [Rhizophagus irregularis]|uniref:Uncharacterized protein n=1 Tax=Rhizophagus irregularis TaxID=588596 RepID=A0A916EKJ9_9GLOM|nr:hypothetical protein OCT59_013792 [Rhizophagus irregularis]CAB5394474.1 unnamed protein product [Rhizophagus irregularis]